MPRGISWFLNNCWHPFWTLYLFLACCFTATEATRDSEFSSPSTTYSYKEEDHYNDEISIWLADATWTQRSPQLLILALHIHGAIGWLQPLGQESLLLLVSLIVRGSSQSTPHSDHAADLLETSKQSRHDSPTNPQLQVINAGC